MWRRIIIVTTAWIAASCAPSGTTTPHYHGALNTTRWEALTPRARRPLARREPPRRRVRCDLRAELITGASKLYERGESGNDFGQRDVERLLDETGISSRWRAGSGVESLASIARRRGAFSSGGDVRPGDLVFFHNVADGNRNGRNDDWLQAVGVAVAREGEVVEAIVRTGNAPRKVFLLPGGPGVRTLDGRVVNSYLRRPSRTDPPLTDYLAGRLYAGHIDLEAFAGSGGCTKR